MRSDASLPFRPGWVLPILACVVALSGCQSTGRPTPVAAAVPPPPPPAAGPPAGYGTQAYTPANFRLPEGAGCSGAIARWQAIQDNDYASGNVNLKVYNQIKGEIAQAAAACSAGHDGEAQAMISASRARHGYPG